MKKMLGLLLYAGLMFGVTAGLGMFMLKKSASHGAATAEHGDEEASEDGSTEHGEEASDHKPAPAASSEHAVASDHGSDNESSHAPSSHGKSEEHDSHSGEPGSSHQDERLPVAVRATPMSVEEIVRMGMSLKTRDEVVRKREESLREIEAQQRLVLSDMAAAQQEIENLLAQTSDQRAAKEELLARMNAQNEALDRERKSIAAEKAVVLDEQEKLAAARKQFDADKSTVAQSDSELALKRKELEVDRKDFEAEKTRIRTDGEKLAKDRETWVAEKEKVSSEMKKIAEERKQLDVDRKLFDQDKRAFLSSSATSDAAGATVKTAPIDAATQQKNLKSMAAIFDNMEPTSAAKGIKTFASTDNLDAAAEVFANMEQRKTSKVFDELLKLDEAFANDILNKISSRNEPSKSAKKP